MVCVCAANFPLLDFRYKCMSVSEILAEPSPSPLLLYTPAPSHSHCTADMLLYPPYDGNVEWRLALVSHVCDACFLLESHPSVGLNPSFCAYALYQLTRVNYLYVAYDMRLLFWLISSHAFLK